MLTEPCTERGGNSTLCKAMLAEYLGTTIPSGRQIHVCHACNNAKCSNPRHLYWGTARENRRDQINSVNRCPLERLEQQYYQWRRNHAKRSL